MDVKDGDLEFWNNIEAAMHANKVKDPGCVSELETVPTFCIPLV